MKTASRFIVLAAGGSLVLGIVAACGGDNGGVNVNGGTAQPTEGGPSPTPVPTAQTQVAVSLVEYSITPDPTTVAPGPVTFVANNIGSTDHELVVIKTDLEPDALPTKDNGSVEGGDKDIHVVGDTDPFPPQRTRTLTVSLEAGSYVLICDVFQEIEGQAPISHYQQGMRTSFVVQ